MRSADLPGYSLKGLKNASLSGVPLPGVPDGMGVDATLMTKALDGERAPGYPLVADLTMSFARDVLDRLEHIPVLDEARVQSLESVNTYLLFPRFAFPKIVERIVGEVASDANKAIEEVGVVHPNTTATFERQNTSGYTSHISLDEVITHGQKRLYDGVRLAFVGGLTQLARLVYKKLEQVHRGNDEAFTFDQMIYSMQKSLAILLEAIPMDAKYLELFFGQLDAYGDIDEGLYDFTSEYEEGEFKGVKLFMRPKARAQANAAYDEYRATNGVDFLGRRPRDLTGCWAETPYAPLVGSLSKRVITVMKAFEPHVSDSEL